MKTKVKKGKTLDLTYTQEHRFVLLLITLHHICLVAHKTSDHSKVSERYVIIYI